MGSVAPQNKMVTVGGLADLQAEAHKEAFEQGLAEGREAGRAEVRAQVERLAGMFYDLAKPFEVLDAVVERELLTLAMALARQIVRRELKADPTQIIGIIREAIAAFWRHLQAVDLMIFAKAVSNWVAGTRRGLSCSGTAAQVYADSRATRRAGD